ncbi:MAG: YIP1 family protein [Candidatus Hodarchaeales archaeon]
MSESESIVCPNCNERSPAGYILCPYCGFDLTKIVRARQRVKITIRESLSRIWRSLYDPRKSKHLFHEIGANPDRKGAILTLIFVSMAYSFRVGALIIKASTPKWHDFHFWYALVFPLLAWIAFFVLAFFAWIISGVIIWLVAKTLGGKTGFRDTLGILGYSLGPLITGSLLISIVIILIGPPITTIDATTWESFKIFDIIYVPFIVFAAYHCGNGIKTAHLLNEPYSYSISGGLALIYILLYLIPAVF